SRGDSTHADLDPPQEQTGKGASLRAPRADSGRPAPLAPGQHFGDRMETGEVEAKVLCGWPERRSSMGLPCSENTEEPRRPSRPRPRAEESSGLTDVRPMGGRLGGRP